MFSRAQNLSDYSRQNLTVWLSLAFQAGCINAGGLLACHRFVTHTTGFATFFGAELAKKEYTTAIGLLTVPAFFLIGSMISAYLVDRRIQNNIKPKYTQVLFLMWLSLTLVFIGGIKQKFGQFGEPDMEKDFVLLSLLCLASGLQNATVTSAFGAIVRTTHLTGLTTDLGIGIVRVVTHSHEENSRRNEIKANFMRIGIILAFGLGSYLAAKVFYLYQFWGFAIPVSIASFLFLWSIYNDRHA